MHHILAITVVCLIALLSAGVLFLDGFIPALRKWWHERKPKPTQEQSRFSAAVFEQVLRDTHAASFPVDEWKSAAVDRLDLSQLDRIPELQRDIELTKEAAAEAIAERDNRIEEFDTSLDRRINGEHVLIRVALERATPDEKTVLMSMILGAKDE